MKFSSLALFLSLFSIATFGQSADIQPNSWKGLVLDKTTVAEAVEKFGKPKSDRLDKVIVPALGDLLTKELKQKKWRILAFNKIENVNTALLVFNSDNRLVLIHFETKDLAPQSFINAYKLPFKPVFSGISQVVNPKDFSKDADANTYAKNYPTSYYLCGMSDESFVVGLISNAPSVGKILKRSAGVPDSSLTYPGYVAGVELISRKLENKDNIEVLK